MVYLIIVVYKYIIYKWLFPSLPDQHHGSGSGAACVAIVFSSFTTPGISHAPCVPVLYYASLTTDTPALGVISVPYSTIYKQRAIIINTVTHRISCLDYKQ